MATLRDLKPCIDDGQVAVRTMPYTGCVEFVDMGPMSGYFYISESRLIPELFTSFDTLVESIGDDEPADCEEAAVYLNAWDLMDDEEA